MKSSTQEELVTHNALGHVLDHPHKKVCGVRDLHPADHITFPRYLSPEADWLKLYWHHAIIEEIDYESDLIHIVHFQPIFDDGFKGSKPPLESFTSDLRKGKILRDSITFSREEVYKVVYGHEECLPEPETILKAVSKVNDIDYNIFKNNCEHFAAWCKTGEKKSFQRKTLNKTISRTAVSTSSKVLTNHAAKRFVLQTPSLAKTLGKAGGRATLLVGVAIEASCAAYDINKARKAQREGHVTKRDCEDIIGKRVAVAVGDVGLSTLGIVGGAAMAGPVGAAVGGLMGSALGTAVGVAAGLIGADIRKTVSEHDVFKWSSQKQIEDKPKVTLSDDKADRPPGADEPNRI